MLASWYAYLMVFWCVLGIGEWASLQFVNIMLVPYFFEFAGCHLADSSIHRKQRRFPLSYQQPAQRDAGSSYPCTRCEWRLFSAALPCRRACILRSCALLLDGSANRNPTGRAFNCLPITKVHQNGCWRQASPWFFTKGTYMATCYDHRTSSIFSVNFEAANMHHVTCVSLWPGTLAFQHNAAGASFSDHSREHTSFCFRWNNSHCGLLVGSLASCNCTAPEQ